MLAEPGAQSPAHLEPRSASHRSEVWCELCCSVRRSSSGQALAVGFGLFLQQMLEWGSLVLFRDGTSPSPFARRLLLVTARTLSDVLGSSLTRMSCYSCTDEQAAAHFVAFTPVQERGRLYQIQTGCPYPPHSTM